MKKLSKDEVKQLFRTEKQSLDKSLNLDVDKTDIDKSVLIDQKPSLVVDANLIKDKNNE